MGSYTTKGLLAAGLVLGVAGVVPAAQANIAEIAEDVLHDEFFDGDLSSDPASPTFLGILESGAPEDGLFFPPNLVRGSLNISESELDLGPSVAPDTQDYFSFTVGAGQALTAIDLLVFDDQSTPEFNDASPGFFVLFGPGDTVADPSAEGFDGGVGGSAFDPPPSFDFELFSGDVDVAVSALVIASLEPTNLLDLIEDGGTTGGSGLDPEVGLGPGTYTLLIEAGGSEDIEYELSLVAEVIPEPASLTLLGLGTLAAFGRRRSR